MSMKQHLGQQIDPREEKAIRRNTFEIHKGSIDEALRNLEDRLRLTYGDQKPYVTLESPGTHLEPAGALAFRPYLEGDPMVNHVERGRVMLVFRPEGLEPLMAYAGREAVTRMDHAFRDAVEAWLSDALMGLGQEGQTILEEEQGAGTAKGLRKAAKQLDTDLDLGRLRLLTSLDQPAYNTPYKVAKRNGGPQTARHYAVRSDTEAAAKTIRAFAPRWSQADHRRLARAHERLSKHYDIQWSRVADEAAQAAFGRPFNVLKGDYKISGIGREEFSPAHKAQLRNLAHRGTDHKALSRVHEHIANHSRNLPLESALGEDGIMEVPEDRAHALLRNFLGSLRLLTPEESAKAISREIETMDSATRSADWNPLAGLSKEDREMALGIYRRLLEVL